MNALMAWPPELGAKVVVLDFDKTITKKHTRGMITQLALLADDAILANFADLKFFQYSCKHIIKCGGRIAIATCACLPTCLPSKCLRDAPLSRPHSCPSTCCLTLLPHLCPCRSIPSTCPVSVCHLTRSSSRDPSCHMILSRNLSGTIPLTRSLPPSCSRGHRGGIPALWH